MLEDGAAGVVGEGDVEGVGDGDAFAEAEDAKLAGFEHPEALADEGEGFEGEVFGATAAAAVAAATATGEGGHGLAVVEGEHDLVGPFRGDGAPHPDFVASVVRGDVGDDAFDVEAFAGAEVAAHLGGVGGGEDEAELFGED